MVCLRTVFVQTSNFVQPGQANGSSTSATTVVIILWGDLPRPDDVIAGSHKDRAGDHHPDRKRSKHSQESMWCCCWAFPQPCWYVWIVIRKTTISNYHCIRDYFKIVVLLCIDDDGNNQWPELLKFLFDSVNSPNVGLREAALHIFWWALNDLQCDIPQESWLSCCSCIVYRIKSMEKAGW